MRAGITKFSTSRNISVTNHKSIYCYNTEYR